MIVCMKSTMSPTPFEVGPIPPDAHMNAELAVIHLHRDGRVRHMIIFVTHGRPRRTTVCLDKAGGVGLRSDARVLTGSGGACVDS